MDFHSQADFSDRLVEEGTEELDSCGLQSVCKADYPLIPSDYPLIPSDYLCCKEASPQKLQIEMEPNWWMDGVFQAQQN